MKLSEARKFTKEMLDNGHKSDGCTLAPDFWIKECCQMHDMLIRFKPACEKTGKKITNWEGDWLYFLFMCRRLFVLAPIYYIAVTLRTIAVEI